MNNPRGRWMAAGLLAARCIGCLGALFGGTRDAGYRFLWAAALAALTVLGGRCLNLPDRRERRCFMALGALMAGAQALGLRLELSGYTGVTGLLLCVGAGVGAGPAAGCALAAAWRGLCALPLGPKERRRSTRQVAWGCAAPVSYTQLWEKMTLLTMCRPFSTMAAAVSSQLDSMARIRTEALLCKASSFSFISRCVCTEKGDVYKRQAHGWAM